VIKGASPPSIVPAFKNVCKKPDCLAEMNSSCAKMHTCGHPCGGFANEKECLPCLEPECISKFNNTAALNKKIPDGHANSDYCAICYTQGLEDKPSVQLGCRHIMHVDCIMKILKQRWTSPRIVFNFANCPQCKVKIEALQCPAINDEM
jgi:E3 ubiquitin-protein ligase MYCBP2